MNSLIPKRMMPTRKDYKDIEHLERLQSRKLKDIEASIFKIPNVTHIHNKDFQKELNTVSFLLYLKKMKKS